jgi:hypothetical protein
MKPKEQLTAKQVQHAKADDKQVEIPAGGGLLSRHSSERWEVLAVPISLPRAARGD